jgi:hypothetical protein
MPALFRHLLRPAQDDPLLRRLLWLCPAVTVVAFAALLLIFGLSLWTAAALALLVACPVAAGWAIVVER